MAWWAWSRTPSSNATADTTINWAEGQAPSSVNDSARSMMARTAEFRDDTSGVLVTVGTATAYALTTYQGLAATPNDGQLLSFKAHVASGASATLQVDNGNTYPLQQVSGTALPTNIIVASGKYDVSFDTSASAYILKGYSPPTNLTNVTVSGTPTTGHVTKWVAPTVIQDAGVASAYLDISGTGMNAPLNLSITATVATNILTVTFLAANTGLGPTSSNPILANFGDATLAAGDPVLLSITASTAISTVVGGTLGAPSGSVAFRHWIGLFNNGGTAVASLINCSTSNQIFALNEAALQSTTAMITGAPGSVAGTYYTPAGTSLTSKAFRIIGYLEYGSGLVTAGTYNNPPSAVRLFGPGTKKPGDIVQSGFTNNASGAASVTITPSSAINLVRVNSTGCALIANGASLLTGTVQTKRGAQLLQQTTLQLQGGGSGGNVEAAFAHVNLDSPSTAASVTYSNIAATFNMDRASLLAEEIMG